MLSSPRTAQKHREPTPAESAASFLRICHGAYDHLTVGPVHAILGGATALFAVGAVESRLWLKSPLEGASFWPRLRFTVRYGLAQIVPSLIWGTQAATRVAERVGLPAGSVWTNNCLEDNAKVSSLRYLRMNRLVAIRGTIAGSILLSQVVSLVSLGSSAREAYERRIREGKEPPLNVEVPAASSQRQRRGVVIRLAGEESDVTTLTLARDGRRSVFPIFEDARSLTVQALVREYGCGPRVPVYWCVENGQYGHRDSWRGVEIPRHWLFDVAHKPGTRGSNEIEDSIEQRKLLVLEADATSSRPSGMSLRREDSKELDLDLYEIAQGFWNLASKVSASTSRDGSAFETLRVLLVDPEVSLRKGGGHYTTAGEHIRRLDLADIIIDARAPLIYAMTKWLGQSSADFQPPLPGLLGRIKARSWRRPVILETPNEEWFQSIKTELGHLGFDVTCMVGAENMHGAEAAKDIPTFVYENSISDTIHTVRRLVEQGIVRRDKVCALFPQHPFALCPQTYGLNSSYPLSEASICSTELYYHLLSWVRHQALDGEHKEDIQRRLDEELGDILDNVI